MSATPATEDAVATTPTLTTESPILRWVPLIGMVLLLVGATRQAMRPLTDPDVWWHLRLGQDFWAGRSLQDPGQWTPYATADWVPTQWTTEMLAAKAAQYFGLPGVAWLFGMSLLAVVLGIYFLCRRDSAPLAAALATGAAFIGAAGSLSPRPHMVTYLFLIVTLWAWRSTTADLKPRWWLVPLSWVWACSHGMWFIGPVTGLVITVGLVLDGRARGRVRNRLLLVPLASLLVAAVTPTGPKLLTAPFAVEGISEYIMEWQAPSFTTLTPAVTLAMVALVVVSWLRHRERLSWTSIAVLAMAAGWTVLYARTVTLGAILVAPLLAQVVQSWLPRRPHLSPGRGERAVVVGAAAMCLVVLAIGLPRVASEPGEVPAALSPAISALDEGTVMYNEYRLGGWLLWEHRNVVPVVDGLTESYEPEHLESHMNSRAMMPGWQETLSDWKVEVALVSSDSPLSAGLQDQLGWQSLGEDAGFVLLAPR